MTLFCALSNDIDTVKADLGAIVTTSSLLLNRPSSSGGQIKNDGTVGTSSARSYCPNFINVDTSKPLHIDCDTGYLYKLSFYSSDNQSSFAEETAYKTGTDTIQPEYPYFRITYSYNPASSSPPATDNLDAIIHITQTSSVIDEVEEVLHGEIQAVSDEVGALTAIVGVYNNSLVAGLSFSNGRIVKSTGVAGTSNNYSVSGRFIQVDTSKPLFFECDTGYTAYLTAYSTDSETGYLGTEAVIEIVAGEQKKIDSPPPFVRLTYATNPLGTAPTPTSDLQVVRVYQQAVKITKSNYYKVLKSGGDFSKLTDALTFAKTNSNITVFVGAGEWDIIDELGDDFFSSYDSNSPKGCFVGNGLHLIFSPKAVVTCHYQGDNSLVRSLFSPFNPGFGDFTIEGMSISASNVRYCVHDDRSGDTANTYHKYINCSMTLDNRNNSDWNATQCIGGGLALSSNIEIVGCLFESLLSKANTELVSWHNSATANAKSTIVIKDCYFKNDGTIRISWYGESVLMSRVMICGNSLGAALRFVPQTDSTVENIELYQWNNEVRSA